MQIKPTHLKALCAAAPVAVGMILVAGLTASPGNAQVSRNAPMPEAPGPNIPNIPGPDIPSPDLDVPDFNVPGNVNVPNVNLPNVPGNVNVPNVNLPNVPGNVNVPNVNVPDIVDLPDLGIPDLNVPNDIADIVPDFNPPKIDVPKVNVPNVGGHAVFRSRILGDQALEPLQRLQLPADQARAAGLAFDVGARPVRLHKRRLLLGL